MNEPRSGFRGAAHGFPTTQWSLVLRATQRDQKEFRDAFGALAHNYRPSMMAFVRAYFRCDDAEAEDIVQSFLARWAESGLGDVDADRGRFRAYLRGGLRHHVQNWRRHELARRRGGQAPTTSLDDAASRLADNQLGSPEKAFDTAYRRQLLSAAVRAMSDQYATEGRPHYMDVFERCYLRPLGTGSDSTYRDIATALEVPVTDVTNWLAHARRRLRETVSALVRESVADEPSYRREMEALWAREGGAR